MKKFKKTPNKSVSSKKRFKLDYKNSDEMIMILAVVGGALLLFTTLIAYYGNSSY